MKLLRCVLFVMLAQIPGACAGAYLFVTFRGEQTAMTEQIYFAVSQDGKQWEALNHSAPALVSTVGERGVRDPYILRAQGNAGFVILATDLSIHNNPDWGRSQTAGSKSLVIWTSKDLTHWSEPALTRVSPEDAGCTWAPEAVYDTQVHDYLVFWASKNRRDNFAKQRIWAAHTTDFKTFGTPFIYIDRPNSVIDADIVNDGHTYYRFTKDEQHSTIVMDTCSTLMGNWTPVESFSLKGLVGYEGPECYKLSAPAAGADPMGGGSGAGAQWCLILDYFSHGGGYKPWVTNDLASGNFQQGSGFKFPFLFRHGSVLPISDQEYQALKAAYQ